MKVNEILNTQNLLSAPFEDNAFIHVALTVLTFSMAVCCPLCLLAAKDAVEMLIFKGNKKMTSRQNLLCTLGLIGLCFGLAVGVPNLASVI